MRLQFETDLASFTRADDAWSNELHRVYGQDAGDARYDRRGTATPALARLHAAFSAHQTAYHNRKVTS